MKRDLSVSGQVRDFPNFSKVFLMVSNLYFLARVNAHDARKYHIILPNLFKFDAKLKKFNIPYILEL